MSRGKGGAETAAEAFLDEGARTMGVWLPLALADLMAALVAVARMWADKPNKVKIPSRSETLASWCLPIMSRSCAAGEEERRALELFESVKRLKKKVEGK